MASEEADARGGDEPCANVADVTGEAPTASAVDIRFLGSGPPGIPEALRAPEGPVVVSLDLARALALAAAVESLIAANLADQARPLAAELRSLIERAHVARAEVVSLAQERGRRRGA